MGDAPRPWTPPTLPDAPPALTPYQDLLRRLVAVAESLEGADEASRGAATLNARMHGRPEGNYSDAYCAGHLVATAEIAGRELRAILAALGVPAPETRTWAPAD